MAARTSKEDVQAVQAALNRRMNAKLDVDGRCGTATINAIMAFQKAIGQSRPDGRVDPGRGTANKLAGTGKLANPPPPPPSPKKLPILGEPVLNRAAAGLARHAAMCSITTSAN